MSRYLSRRHFGRAHNPENTLLVVGALAIGVALGAAVTLLAMGYASKAHGLDRDGLARLSADASRVARDVMEREISADMDGFANSWPRFGRSANVEDMRGADIPLPRHRPARRASR